MPTGPPGAQPQEVWVTLCSLLRVPWRCSASHSGRPTLPSQLPEVDRAYSQLITGVWESLAAGEGGES